MRLARVLITLFEDFRYGVRPTSVRRDEDPIPSWEWTARVWEKASVDRWVAIRGWISEDERCAFWGKDLA